MTTKKATVTVKRIVSEAMTLPNDERTVVAITLLESVDGPPDLHANLSDEEFEEELANRVQSVVDGTAETHSWDQVHARADALLARRQK